MMMPAKGTGALNSRSLLFWLTAGFAVMAAILAFVIASFLANARDQVIGADYTALVGDVVRAQEGTHRLRKSLETQLTNPGTPHVLRIDRAAGLSKTQLNGIQRSLTRYPHLDAARLRLADDFILIGKQLAALDDLTDRSLEAPKRRSALQALAREIEANMAWVYSELNAAVHEAAAARYLATRKLASTVLILVLLVLTVTTFLFGAVLHLRQQRKAMKTLMLTDDLTGLYNRRFLISIASKQLAIAERHWKPLSLALFDLDHFKSINDTHGHPAGDAVLRRISDTIGIYSRQSDTLARIGGEEFCLLMLETDTAEADQMAQRIRAAVSLVCLDDIAADLAVTVSIGVTSTRTGSESFDQLYYLADKALYQAKDKGRNRTEIQLPSDAAVGLTGTGQ